MAMLKLRPLSLYFARYASQTPSGSKPTPPPPAKPVTAPPSPPVKPAAAATNEDPTKYNAPDYYQHNEFSFYDLDASLKKHRLPQPSKFDPLVPKK